MINGIIVCLTIPLSVYLLAKLAVNIYMCGVKRGIEETNKRLCEMTLFIDIFQDDGKGTITEIIFRELEKGERIKSFEKQKPS